jgi:hypothetical protein
LFRSVSGLAKALGAMEGVRAEVFGSEDEFWRMTAADGSR